MLALLCSVMIMTLLFELFHQIFFQVMTRRVLDKTLIHHPLITFRLMKERRGHLGWHGGEEIISKSFVKSELLLLAILKVEHMCKYIYAFWSFASFLSSPVLKSNQVSRLPLLIQFNSIHNSKQLYRKQSTHYYLKWSVIRDN